MENGKSGLRAKLPGGLNVGIPGRGVVSIVRTGGNGAPGTDDTYTITYTDGTISTYTVHNGADGKTAYQYAVDGGYTGSEEDFAKMLAGGGYTLPVATAEISSVLPNLPTTIKSTAPYMACSSRASSTGKQNRIRGERIFPRVKLLVCSIICAPWPYSALL
jgi:hypothetical protein